MIALPVLTSLKGCFKLAHLLSRQDRERAHREHEANLEM